MLDNVAEPATTAAELSNIRLLLIAILIVVVLSACLGVLRFAAHSLRPLFSMWEDFFQHEAKRLLDSDDIGELIRFAQDKLNRRPNHVYAHWYLARAYYLQEKWAESLAEFREVARLDPTWIEDHVKPYVSAIERKTADETIH
ncbi:tetratricopeptide repeat protein [Dongia deserti]|uniref:tetratricopeptide repeat protein n=1 Tax=Dongia deserti TaxID=2268030 RepID=UPI0013C51DC1|nr:tetratricopeptide repeat protein [Dongia deserti]